MREVFPLFSNPIDLAHDYWARLIKPGDLAIDATCGNGKDTLALLKLKAQVIAMDTQQEAVVKTRKLLEENQELENATLIHRSHETFPENIQEGTVKLIVYNLGYLPGGNKTYTTLTHSTLKSIKQALPLIAKGGAISITCYPGHPEGEEEQKALLSFSMKLNPKQWCASHQTWVNRTLSPSLLLLQNVK